MGSKHPAPIRPIAGSIPIETSNLIRTNTSRTYGTMLVLSWICNSQNTDWAGCIREMWICHCFSECFLQWSIDAFLTVIVAHAPPWIETRNWQPLSLIFCSSWGSYMPVPENGKGSQNAAAVRKVKTEGYWGASPTVLEAGMSKCKITAPLKFVAVKSTEYESWTNSTIWNLSIKVGKEVIVLLSTRHACLRAWMSPGNIGWIRFAQKKILKNAA